jgi:hypothetical protein
MCGELLPAIKPGRYDVMLSMPGLLNPLLQFCKTSFMCFSINSKKSSLLVGIELPKTPLTSSMLCRFISILFYCITRCLHE